MGKPSKPTFSPEEKQLIHQMKQDLTAMGVVDKKEQAMYIQQELMMRRNPGTNMMTPQKPQTVIQRIKEKLQFLGQKVIKRTVLRDQSMMDDKTLQKMFGMSKSPIGNDSEDDFDPSILSEFAKTDEEEFNKHGTFVDGRPKTKTREVDLDDDDEQK